MSGLFVRAVSRIALFFGVAFLCVVGLTAALILAILAIYFAFALIISPPLAALASAACALVLTGVIGLAGSGLLRFAGKPLPRKNTLRERARGSVLAEFLGPELVDLVDRHPAKTLAIALAAGLVVGISPAARRVLRDLIRR